MRLTFQFFLLFIALSVVAATARAQVDTVKADTSKVYRQEEILVSAQRPKEEQPVGPYKQPEWTLHRRSPSTRVYIQTLPGQIEFEQWVEVRIPSKNSNENTIARFAQELEIGLGEHTQLDIYVNTLREWNNGSSSFGLRGFSAEMRWAFADWGVIPGNPTIYFEYSVFDSVNGDEGNGYDKIEPKLLLGDEIGKRWHWGLNLVTERSLAPADFRTIEYAASGVLSYRLSDQGTSLGAAFCIKNETAKSGGNIAGIDRQVLLGPSFQWRPIKKAHLDLEPLFGLTDESRQLDLFVVFGLEL